MAKFSHPINAFSSGELGPKVTSRFDIDEYKQGAAEVLNMIPYKSGGMARRPGSRNVAQVSSVLGANNILSGVYPFIFSQTEAYIVVISPGYGSPDSSIQVFRRNGSPVSLVYNTAATDYFVLPQFDTALDTSGFQYAQSGDILYFTHSSGTYPPFVVKRLAEDSFEVQHIWGLGAYYEPVVTNAYLPANADSAKLLYFSSATTIATFTIQNGATLDQKTVTACDAAGTSIATVFKQTHVGSIWRCSETGAGNECAFYIQNVAVDLKTATVVMLIGIDASLVGVGQRDDNWNEGEWSDENGWPRTISFFNQRLIFGGNISSPDTLWVSKTGDYRNFLAGRLDQDLVDDVSGLDHFGVAVDDDPFNATLASTEVNEISWLSADDVLVCGTSGSEYTISSVDGVFGKNNINIEPKSSFGSKPIQAFKAGEGILYISRDGKRIRRFKYQLSTGEQSNVDLTTLNSDIVYHNPDTGGTVASTEFKSITIEQMAWQESRSTMWFITSNKALIGFTIDKKSGVAGWHRHTLASADGAQAEVLGVTVLPNETNTFLDVWIIVKRTVFISEVITLEKIADDFEHTILSNTSADENDHPIYLDASVRYTAAEASETRTFTPPTTINLTTEQITFEGKHRYHHGQEVQFTSTGGLPAGLSLSTNYYLIVESDITFYVATTLANANIGKSVAINLTTYGTGVHSVVPTAVTTLTTWSGYGHLLAQDVKTLQDGVEVDESIGIGSLILGHGLGENITTDPISELIVGLPYTSRLTTLPLSVESRSGTTRGDIVRIDRADLMLYKTYTGKFGSEATNLEAIAYDSVPFSGDKSLDLPSTPDRLGQVIVETDTALPLSILGMALRGLSNGG